MAEGKVARFRIENLSPVEAIALSKSFEIAQRMEDESQELQQKAHSLKMSAGNARIESLRAIAAGREAPKIVGRWEVKRPAENELVIEYDCEDPANKEPEALTPN